MPDNLQISLFFCEDVRMELNGKPFLIGLLAPVIYGGSGTDDDFYLVTSVTSPPSITKVDLQLSVTIDGPDRESETKTHAQTIEWSAEEIEPDEPWKAWLPLQVSVPNCLPGVRIRADLVSEHGSAWASLAVRSPEELADEE